VIKLKETRFENVLKLYNKKYELRFCRQDEYNRLIYFLDCFWRKNHILVKSKELLDWQYLDKDKKQYNFVFAIERKTNDIHGVLGFIKTDLFDKNIKTPMRWGAIWKVREYVANMGLGLAMKLFLYENVKAPYAGGIGLSKYSKKINQKMGEEMGVLNHYYMINQKTNNFESTN